MDWLASETRSEDYVVKINNRPGLPACFGDFVHIEASSLLHTHQSSRYEDA
jgi:hypothetical protein